MDLKNPLDPRPRLENSYEPFSDKLLLYDSGKEQLKELPYWLTIPYRGKSGTVPPLNWLPCQDYLLPLALMIIPLWKKT